MKKILTLLACLVITGAAYAQQPTSPKDTSSADALLNSLNGSNKDEPVNATFKSTKLIFSQTTETNKKNNLNFIVTHKFGDVGSPDGGSKSLYGLDDASDV